MKTIQELWDLKMCPPVSGIYFENNTVAKMAISMPWDHKTDDILIVMNDIKSLSDAMSSNDEVGLSHLGVLCSEFYHEKDLMIFGGCGSYGSEGFIAVVESKKNRIIWLAYFDCSNEFEKVYLENDIVVGITNLQHTWKLPLIEPQKIHVNVSAHVGQISKA